MFAQRKADLSNATAVLLVQAAQGAGMLSVAMPPALSARGRFPAADATFDGFGYGGGLHWPRLQMLLDKRKQNARA